MKHKSHFEKKWLFYLKFLLLVTLRHMLMFALRQGRSDRFCLIPARKSDIFIQEG